MTFTCHRCGITYVAENTTEDMVAEAVQHWPEQELRDDPMVVCDACYREVMDFGKPERK